MTTDPPPQAAPQGRRSPLILLAVGLVALAVGLGLAAGLGDGAATAAREHLSGAAADPDGAFAECAPGFEPARTLEAFRAFVATHPEWYQAEQVRFTGRRAEAERVTLSGAATSRGGEASPVEVVVVRLGDRWRVVRVGRP